MTILNPRSDGSPYGDGLYGLQAQNGVDVIAGSHECAKTGCKTPALVAVFGQLQGSSKSYRTNTCRPHVELAFSELDDAWMAALVAEHTPGRDYCPHCAGRRFGPQGQGHLRHCPIGLTSREFAAAARLEQAGHNPHECEVCSAYFERKPGPTG